MHGNLTDSERASVRRKLKRAALREEGVDWHRLFHNWDNSGGLDREAFRCSCSVDVSRPPPLDLCTRCGWPDACIHARTALSSCVLFLIDHGLVAVPRQGRGASGCAAARLGLLGRHGGQALSLHRRRPLQQHRGACVVTAGTSNRQRATSSGPLHPSWQTPVTLWPLVD